AKLLAFAAGASFAGVMGVVFSAKQVFINPESFTFLESIGVLAMVILGGMGSIPGAIIGATVVTVLNLQVLKGLSLWLNELKNAGVTILGYNLAGLPTQLEPAKYERMIFGLILVFMMIFRPQGIFPAPRRQRELPGPGPRGPAPGRDHRARRLPHLPEHPPLRQHDRRRKRAGRHARPHPARAARGARARAALRGDRARALAASGSAARARG